MCVGCRMKYSQECQLIKYRELSVIFNLQTYGMSRHRASVLPMHILVGCSAHEQEQSGAVPQKKLTSSLELSQHGLNATLKTLLY